VTEADLRARLEIALAGEGRPSSDYDLNPGTLLPDGRPLRPAGVLVAARLTAAGPSLILTKRASGLKHHPGQIAFPGGKVDPGDDGPVGAALRETCEEIALRPSSVTVLGSLPPHETVTGFLVTPVLALVTGAYSAVPEPGEVDEAFDVPLEFLMNAANYRIEGRVWRGTMRRYYAIPWGPYYIWGATARMLRALADRMGAA
jgi:8-oxo-dGTP pyrophosphatase MutT (NUDIX family)